MAFLHWLPEWGDQKGCLPTASDGRHIGHVKLGEVFLHPGFGQRVLASGHGWEWQGEDSGVHPPGALPVQADALWFVQRPLHVRQLMDVVLKGLVGVRCLVYLDDVIVFGATIGECCDHLEEVLQRLEKAGLKIKGSKCPLFQPEV